MFKSERLYDKHVNEVHKLGSNNQRFFCQTCDITFINLEVYHNHLRQVHETKLRPLLKRARSKANYSIKPDPDDLKFYYKSCSTNYSTRIKFRGHIRNVHKTIILEPLKKALTNPNHNIKPDPNDPNFYCKFCSVEYPSIGEFRRHLSRTHKMILKPLLKRSKLPNHNIKPDPEDPNFFCKSCSTKYSHLQRFRIHLRCVHKMILKPLKRRHSKQNYGIKPDPDDPNLYCKSCDIKYPYRSSFQHHLRGVHKILI